MDRREFIKYLLYSCLCSATYPVISYKKALSFCIDDIKGAKKYITGCMWCQSGCSMIVYIRDKKIIHITGNPDDPVTKGKICIKPFGTIEILNSPYRLKHPLKRIGNSYKKISWKQALDEIAEKLIKLKSKYGGECLGIWASGRSSFDGRLLNNAFAKLYGTPNWEKTGPFCNYSGKIAGITTTGTRHCPWIYEDHDFYSADLYIFVGSNMAVTRPPIFQNLKEEKQKRNCKFVCIDPRKTETAQDSDIWLPIKPGTDLALALGIIHFILSNGIEDKNFIQEKTTNFELFKKELFNNNYTIEWAAQITGLQVDQLKKLAILYAKTKKAIIIGNTGISHHTNSVHTHRAFAMLAAICGHYCSPSTGYGCLNNGGHKIGKIPIKKTDIPPHRPSLGKNPAKWLKSLEGTSYPYQLRALISTGSPLTQWPQQRKIRKLIEKLELSVWNGIVPSINSYYFKYILPAATWIEAGGISPVSDDSRFVLVPKLIDPPGQAKPDRWWWIELGKRMGWKEIFKDEFKDYKKLINFACSKYGFSINEFLRQKNTLSLRAPKNRTTLFLDGKFHTKDGKFNFYYSPKKFKKYGLNSFPHFYKDPDLAERGEITIKYINKLIKSPFQNQKCFTSPVTLIKKQDLNLFPLFLITGRPSWAIMGDATHWSKLLSSISPNQLCIINPKTAKKFNIKDNSIVKITSPYGETTCLSKLSFGIREDTVFVPYSFGMNQPYSKWKSVNFLISIDAICPISGQIAFKGTRVKIEKL